MSFQTIQTLIVAILSISYLLGLLTTVLSARNSQKGIPIELKADYSEAKYEESVRYTLIRSNFSIIVSSFGLIVILAFIYFGGFAYVDKLVSSRFQDEKIQGIVYFGLLFLLSDLINLPLQLYSQFSIEEQFGFNKMSLKLFFIDKVKSYLLAAILGGLILYALFWLLELFGENFWIYFWIVMAVFTLFANIFYTSWIVPLFNKLTPLEDGELKRKITEYGKSVGFPIDNIYVIDGSKRSSKANAFFSGLGKRKKVVLYDTLIEDLTEDEIVAVLAHEVGHFKKKHIVWSLIFSLIQMGAILFLASRIIFFEELSQALGLEEMKVYVNLIVFSILLSPISTLLGIVGNIISRKNEYEADNYAKETFNGRSLVSALRKLSENNLSNLNPHPIDVFINYSHPPVYKRYRTLLS